MTLKFVGRSADGYLEVMSSDPAIEQYAAGLSQKAGSRVSRCTGLGLALGALVGATPLLAPAVSHVHSYVPHSLAYAILIVGIAAGGYLGFLIGQSRAVALRLQASLAVHQLEMGRALSRVEAGRLPLPDMASLPSAAPDPLPLAPPPPAPVVSLPAPPPAPAIAAAPAAVQPEPLPVAPPPLPVAQPAPAPVPVAQPAPVPVAEPAPAPVAQPAPAPMPLPAPVLMPLTVPVSEPAAPPFSAPAPVPAPAPAPAPAAAPALEPLPAPLMPTPATVSYLPPALPPTFEWAPPTNSVDEATS
jgi:hypothetical protein